VLSREAIINLSILILLMSFLKTVGAEKYIQKTFRNRIVIKK